METLYDERGVQYKLPIFCIANPIELCGESPNTGAGASGASSSSAFTADLSSSSITSSGANNRPVAVASLVTPESHGMSVNRSATKLVEAQPLNLKIRINPGKKNKIMLILLCLKFTSQRLCEYSIHTPSLTLCRWGRVLGCSTAPNEN